MTDFLLENEIRHLIAKANMYDELGNTEAANEVDELVKVLLQRVGLEKEAGPIVDPVMQKDIEGILAMLEKIKELREELLEYGPGYLDKLKRMLATPNLDPQQKAYIEHLQSQVSSALAGKNVAANLQKEAAPAWLKDPHADLEKEVLAAAVGKSDMAKVDVEAAKTDAEMTVKGQLDRSVPEGVQYRIVYDRYHYEPDRINPETVYVRGYAEKA